MPEIGVVRRERDMTVHLAKCRKSPAGSGVIGLPAAIAASDSCAGEWSCHHFRSDETPPMIAELLTLICCSTEAIHLPRLAHLASGTGIAGAMAFVVHGGSVR